MTIRPLLISLVIACGGGGKKADPASPTPPADPAPADPAPVATTTSPAEPAAPAPAQAEPAVPAGPKLALAELKIVMKAKGKTETLESDITVAADGAMTAKLTKIVGKKRDVKTNTGKLTADGKLLDDKGEVVAELADDGSLLARQTMVEQRNGKVVKTDSSMANVGTLDADGTFTAKKDGAKYAIDDKGKIAGLPGDFTVTAKPEQKRAAMMVAISMFAATTMTTDSSSGAAPEPAPTPKKK